MHAVFMVRRIVADGYVGWLSVSVRWWSRACMSLTWTCYDFATVNIEFCLMSDRLGKGGEEAHVYMYRKTVAGIAVLCLGRGDELRAS